MPQKAISQNYTGNPWDRQPRESLLQHARFKIHLELGRTRTLNATCGMLNDIGDSIRYSTITIISAQFRWRERSELWDLDQEKEDRERLMRERKEMIAEHKNIAKHLIIKAMDALMAMEPCDMTPQDVIRYLKLATDLQRIIFGEANKQDNPKIKEEEEETTLTSAERRERLLELSRELELRANSTGIEVE